MLKTCAACYGIDSATLRTPLCRTHFSRIHDIASPEPAMTVTDHILRVLDGALNLQGRALAFDVQTPLLGALPELDSMAVLALITGLESHFGIAFSDDDLNGSAFATVGSLVELVEQALAGQNT